MHASSRDRVDVVIVGSGPAGAAYARTLAEEAPSCAVLMVDAGPQISSPPGRHVTNIPDDAARRAAQRLAMGAAGPASAGARPGLLVLDVGATEFPGAAAACNVGGMGAHWFGACPRPYGSERTRLLTETQLNGALDEAERLLHVEARASENEVSTWVRARLNEALGAGRPPDRAVQFMPLAIRSDEGGAYRSGSDTVLGDPTLTSEHFELRPRTLCRRVVMDRARATGVELVDLESGAVSTMRAAHVVVAADALRTPQLLFASGVRPRALGRNLNEHMQFAATVALDDGPRGTRYVRQPGDFSMLTDNGQIVALSEPGVTWIPFTGSHFPFSAQIAVIDPESLDGGSPERPIVAVHMFSGKDVRPSDRIEFCPDERDWTGLPAMKVTYGFSDADLALHRRARDTLLRIVQALGTPIGPEPLSTLAVGSSLHYQGAYRMGAAPDHSVCDRRSVVWGTDNLRVAGNGLIETATACNPTLTSVAYAVLGARDIADALRARSSRIAA